MGAILECFLGSDFEKKMRIVKGKLVLQQMHSLWVDFVAGKAVH